MGDTTEGIMGIMAIIMEVIMEDIMEEEIIITTGIDIDMYSSI